MKKKRRFIYRPRAKRTESIEDGQDSFLDVVSNLVGILIILVMVAGARVHEAADDALANDSAQVKKLSPEEQAEQAKRKEYVEAVETLKAKRAELEKTRLEAEDFNERYMMVEQQAAGAEQEYRDLLTTSAQIDAALKAEAQKKEESEQVEYDLQSALFEKEKKLDDLRKEKEALLAARPKATLLENLPTPISQRVEEGREGFFQLKNGRIAHVPLNEFQERVRLYFENFRGDVSKDVFEEKIGPVENFDFHYIVDLRKTRESDGLHYYMEFRYGECIPRSAEIGEPVDAALASKESKFCKSLLKYNRQDTTITIFVYPDSFEYLRDVKKLLFSLKYQTALRPLPDGVPIAVSPNGTASASY